jgi:PAS domain S-box-containing protein
VSLFLKSPDELLETACRRIGDTDRPAYVKNSDLKYIAVNQAYAEFFGRAIPDFIGCRSDELSNVPEDRGRADKERRVIVFGTEETSTCSGRDGQTVFEVQIESFRPSDDRAYVFGIFAEAPIASRTEGRTSASEGSSDLAQVQAQLENMPYPIGIASKDGRMLVANRTFRAQQAGQHIALSLPAETAALQSVITDDILDLIDIGVCVYNTDADLVYCNERWRDLYRPVIGEARLGMNAREIYAMLFDLWSKQPGWSGADRQEWISQRLALLVGGDDDTVERLPDGRWLRCANKRLPGGYVAGLRIDVTSMKEQELLLRKHFDEGILYRTILIDLPVSVFVRSADHRLVYGNEAYFKITGLTRQDSLGKTEHEMFGKGADAFFANNELVLREKQLLEYESEGRYEGNRVHSLVTRMNSVSTSDGRQYLVGSMTDVSALKLRETQLIETRARAESLRQDLENIIGSMPVGVMILDRNFDLEYANDTFYEIWSLSNEDRREGRTLRELMRRNYARGNYGPDNDDFEALYKARTEAISRPGAHLQSEISFGDDRRIVLDAQRISDDRILLSYVDISSLRRQERELSEGRVALERLGELMTDATHAMMQGLLIVENGVIMLSNDALPTMLRIAPSSLTAGKKWAAVFQQCAVRGDLGADPRSTLKEWAEKIRLRQPISSAFHIAGERWVHMDASMSAADRWLVVFTDVTEAKERETELQRLLSRSEAADRAKSEFLANMSHEIRTPMNGVLGMAELLTRTGLDARQRTFTDIIVKSGNALLTIINDILDFSKIDAGQMRLRQTPFDPVEALEDVATLLSSQAGEKNIDLLVRASPLVPPMVLGDAGRFRQMLTNLVGNAVKFTEHGHVLIDLDVNQTPDGAEMITVTVSDTGTGISRERLDSIFDKFSQVDSSSTRRHEGTGLGLAITAGLVDLFGGYLNVDSTLGSGSMFKIHLPLPTASIRRDQSLTPLNVNGAQILVIDDNAINRQILLEQLTMWGFAGVAVADGQSGLAILDAASDMGVAVDALILDYSMPGMNGADVASTMRRDPRFDTIPIIFLTSMEVAVSGKDFAALTGDAHLMKPARSNVLRSTIINVLRTARRRAAGGDVPRAVPSPAAQSGALAGSAPLLVPATSDGALDILVAEDNEVNQIVFTQILQAVGARFLVVANGEEAVSAYRLHAPRLIMMDVSMPVMNGLEATRLIRRIEAEVGAGQHVPIIGVTAYALENDRDLCFDAGMDDYMSKPISPELLEAKISLWLKGEKNKGTGSGG